MITVGLLLLFSIPPPPPPLPPEQPPALLPRNTQLITVGLLWSLYIPPPRLCGRRDELALPAVTVQLLEALVILISAGFALPRRTD